MLVRTAAHCCAVMLLALFGLVTPGTAAVIFDNGPPGNQDGYNFSNSVVDDFTLSQTTNLTSVRFWAYSDNVANLQQIGWGIYTNSTSQPGSLLFSGLDTTATVTNTGVVLPGNPFYAVYQVDFDLQISALSADSYWLQIDSGPIGTNNTPGFNGWVFSQAGSGNEALIEFSWQPGWTNAGMHGQNAFQLFGAPVSVPEPISLALFGSGLAGLGMIRRRRKP